MINQKKLLTLLRLTMFSVDMCIMWHIQPDKLCNKLEISVSGWCMWYIEAFVGSVYSQLTDRYSFVRAIK